ncbi:sigma factor-like helix-turn-helix DNA-binding protein [Spirosoma agri]|jgi:RNA polymerase sigma-70 factor (ECF subfamily)|uniref:RNA polymerase sigma factor 70 region 4 type 2 domain-containing protein n=1 Tax=Spirosoma agri TaxID=1987381 RepID=A0A6M0INZ1_9BACT|nr:sigma factor-like helix-turn-helix DNA-binding protein [Spirosoma agri]NEU68643.1 hypothetical protein [Spirosoma agri]
MKDLVLAEDTLQDVYPKQWTSREEVGESPLRDPALAKALRYQTINTLRDEKQTILRHLGLQSPEERLALSEYGSVVLTGLRQLSAQRRLVFLLRSDRGLTNEEIASRLQISVVMVNAQYYHACRFLRDYLRQHAGIEAMIVWLAVFVN